MGMTTVTYETWLRNVDEALNSINMPMDDWQSIWPFDFQGAFDAGASVEDTAMKANRFWWKQQNKTLEQDCQKTSGCWLPRNHQGDCQPV